jgi:hypothetical protein
MLHRIYLASNDASHDNVTCARCLEVYPHLPRYQCSGCGMHFHCERIGHKHVCRRPSKKQRRARGPLRESYVAPKLELGEASTEYVAPLDHELHAMVGNVYRVRETSRNGLRGPLLGFVVNALSPMQIKLEILTMTAGKVGSRGLRQGIHKDGRYMITRPIQDLRAVVATDCVDVGAALFFDLTVRQSVWRGFKAFYAHSPVLLRPTLESLATLQCKDRDGIKWVEATAKTSLHPDRVVKHIQFLYSEGYVTKEQVGILTRFVTDAFVRVCNTL